MSSPPRPRRTVVAAVAIGVFVVVTATAGARTRGGDVDLRDAAIAPFLVDDDHLTPVTVPARPLAPDLTTVVAESVRSLSAFWAHQLPRLYGVDDVSRPGLAPFLPSSGLVPPCGPVTDTSTMVRQAFYCGTGDVVAWDAELLFPEAYTYFDPLSPAVILAHEWAHAVQRRAGVVASSLVVELQADCFAGAWLAATSSSPLGSQRRRFVDRGPRFFAWIGDPGPEGRSVGDDERHGNGSQRYDAFVNGFRVGPEICVTYETSLPPELDR